MRSLASVLFVSLTVACALASCAESKSDVVVPPAGPACTGGVGGIVWHDVDANGLREPGEPGVAGIVLRLFDGAGLLVALRDTDGAGAYAFPDLCAGSYLLTVDTSGFGAPTLPSACGGNANCSAIQIVLSNDQEVRELDLGLRVCAAELGDRVWFDLDCDGLQGPADPGIAGVLVELLDEAGTPLASVVTDAGGFFAFRDLCRANYVVRIADETLPEGSFATACDVGDDEAQDSECSPAPRSVASDAEVDLDLDFGYCLPCAGAIGDFVWFDSDCDGLQGPGEDGLEGIHVFLRDAGGRVLSQTTSGSDGHWEFTGLCTGTYLVEIDLLPARLVPTFCEVGSDDGLDSSCNPALVTLASDFAVEATIDFGLCELTSAVGTVPGFSAPPAATRANGPVQIAGRVVDDEPSGLDLGRLVVVARDPAGRISALAAVEPDGSYTLRGLAAGAFELGLEVAPGTPERRTYALRLDGLRQGVEVAPGASLVVDWRLR